MFKDYVSGISNNWLICILIAATIFCAVLAAGNQHDERIFFSSCMLIILTTIIYIRQSGHRRKAAMDRVLSIEETLREEPRLAQRAKDMYLSSEYYRGRANFNSIASIITLFVLMIFVGFAGSFLNKDTVQFDAVQKFENLIDSRDLRASNDAETQAQILRIKQNYSDALKQQVEAEAAINQPVYRVASGLLIRVSAVAVAIYLVIIMNRSFKYNNNLAAIYRSRFIALLKGDDDFDSFARYALLLSTETIDYDTRIENPAERMLSLFDKIKETFKSSKSMPESSRSDGQNS